MDESALRHFLQTGWVGGTRYLSPWESSLLDQYRASATNAAASLSPFGRRSFRSRLPRLTADELDAVLAAAPPRTGRGRPANPVRDWRIRMARNWLSEKTEPCAREVIAGALDLSPDAVKSALGKCKSATPYGTFRPLSR